MFDRARRRGGAGGLTQACQRGSACWDAMMAWNAPDVHAGGEHG